MLYNFDPCESWIKVVDGTSWCLIWDWFLFIGLSGQKWRCEWNSVWWLRLWPMFIGEIEKVFKSVGKELETQSYGKKKVTLLSGFGDHCKIFNYPKFELGPAKLIARWSYKYWRFYVYLVSCNVCPMFTLVIPAIWLTLWLLIINVCRAFQSN